MNIRDFSDLAKVIDSFDDHFFWEPINKSVESLEMFDRLLAVVDDSQNWPPARNREKGVALEDFAEFLFSRFQGADTKKNRLAGGNETDIETVLSERVRPTFLNDFVGPKMICECKNKKNDSVDVGMVSKLDELLGTRGSRFGVFISILGIGGTGWRFGEGKRKKLFIESRRTKSIISFTVDELRCLRENNANFYTMIKQKIQMLFDEIDDDSPGIPTTESHPEYSKYIFDLARHLRKCELITDDESQRIIERIQLRYGLQVEKPE